MRRFMLSIMALILSVGLAVTAFAHQPGENNVETCRQGTAQVGDALNGPYFYVHWVVNGRYGVAGPMPRLDALDALNYLRIQGIYGWLSLAG